MANWRDAIALMLKKGKTKKKKINIAMIGYFINYFGNFA
jgi:hypothetical protein